MNYLEKTIQWCRVCKMDKKQIGVLITNVGTPDEPEEAAVRHYLAEFLSDPKVIDYPRWFWLPLLKRVILKSRPARSAQLYKNIWRPDGSPLLILMQSIARKLENALTNTTQHRVWVTIGMRYGNPSLRKGLNQLLLKNLDSLIIFPLYPQYSITTTGTTIESVREILGSKVSRPSIHLIDGYHDHPDYIAALTGKIEDSWKNQIKPERILFSFHGVPQRYRKIDDYYEQCRKTAELVAKELELEADDWQIAFQSKFGPEPWLKPYTEDILKTWGKSGIQSVSVIAPGFSVDCLETTDELGREARHIYLEAGGKQFQYIPALNDSDSHISVLKNIIQNRL